MDPFSHDPNQSHPALPCSEPHRLHGTSPQKAQVALPRHRSPPTRTPRDGTSSNDPRSRRSVRPSDHLTCPKQLQSPTNGDLSEKPKTYCIMIISTYSDSSPSILFQNRVFIVFSVNLYQAHLLAREFHWACDWGIGVFDQSQKPALSHIAVAPQSTM